MHETVKRDLDEIIESLGLETLRKFEGKEVLISGACGFLGSWFLAIFQRLNKFHFEKPVSVYAIDSFIAADNWNMIDDINDRNIRFVEGDISKMIFGDHDHIDFIIHAAGVASPIYYNKYPIETIDGMVFGLRNLLNFTVTNPVESFLFFSSSEMYGNPHPEKVPTKEDYNGNVSCIGPRSCYDESKRMGETMCHSYHRIHGTPVKWVRPFNVYGPGMRIKDDRVVPKFTFQLLRDENITVHIPGVQTRTFCYIVDAMVGFLKTLLIGRSGEVYNIGRQDGEMSIVELAEKMKDIFPPSKGEIVKIEMPQEYPSDQAQRRCPDISKAKEHLNYTPKVTLEDGLSRTYEWCKDALKKDTKSIYPQPRRDV